MTSNAGASNTFNTVTFNIVVIIYYDIHPFLMDNNIDKNMN